MDSLIKKLREIADTWNHSPSDVFPILNSLVGIRPCAWTYHSRYSEFSEDYWETDCGESYTMIEGTPKENGYNYCPSCGRELVEIVLPDEDEELEDDCEDDPRRNGALV